MKQIIPFSKELRFKTMIGEITSISLEHTLKHDNTYNILGDFIVAGTYKMDIKSELEEDFSYKIPVDIEVNEKYDVGNMNIFIDDFYYEIINEEILKVNIKLCIDNLEEKLIPTPSEEVNTKELLQDNLEFDVRSEEKDSKIQKEEYIEDIIKDDEKPTDSLINPPTANTYKCYLVYIVRENDTLDGIMERYNITKEELCKYNNLDEYKLGMKIIIPSNNEQ